MNDNDTSTPVTPEPAPAPAAPKASRKAAAAPAVIENDTSTVAQPSGTVAGTATPYEGNYAVGTFVSESGFTVTHR
jgi:hypothetical protein